MNQYILLIQRQVVESPTEEEWEAFFVAAGQSGCFKGGSEIGDRTIVGNAEVARSTDHVVGFMRFDAEDPQEVLDLLKIHPVVLRGGAVELCELPKSP